MELAKFKEELNDIIFLKEIMELILLKEIYIGNFNTVEKVQKADNWVAKTLGILIDKHLIKGNGTFYEEYRITNDGAVVLEKYGKTINLIEKYFTEK